MRIGLVYLGRRGPGGPITLLLAKHLSRHGEIFCAVSENSDHVQEWKKSPFPVIIVPTFRTKTAAFLSYFTSVRITDLARRIRERTPDVIIYPMVHPWTPRLQRGLRDIPDVVVVHDPLPHPGLLHRMSGLWEIRAARRASRCVVLGQMFVEVLTKQGIAKDRIDVIPHGVFVQYAGFKNPAIKPEATNTILFFGRITEYKGIDVLLKAFQRLVRERSDVRLQIVGDGNLRPYEALLKSTTNVTVVNRWIDESEVAKYLLNASMLALPYTSASQSGVIAAAAALATPVIATRVGAIPEQIVDKKTGVLIDPGSVDQLFDAMKLLLDEPRFASELGRNLAQRTNETANWDLIAASFIDTCNKAVS